MSDEETVYQIQENPYLQYFVGLKDFQPLQPFAPSLFVEIRKRMGQRVFEAFHQAIVEQVEVSTSRQSPRSPSDDNENPPNKPSDTDTSTPVSKPIETPVAVEKEASTTHKGKLILDATVAEQAIRYPTDLSLLNEAQELTEKIIDHLCPLTAETKKPRTYRQIARKRFLAIVKQRRPRKNILRKGIRQQLQYLKRNIGHIERLMDHCPIPLPR